MNLDGSSFSVLRALSFIPDGVTQPTGIIQGTDGSLYGTSEGGSGGGTIFNLGLDGSNFMVLLDLDSSGIHPPIQGKDGRLYGTTDSGPNDVGTIYRISTNGSAYTVLRNMDFSQTQPPFPSLIQGADGTLYGAGYNTIYQMNPDGTDFTVLQTLDNATQGSQISAPLFLANNGALYGTASAGGTNNLGTIFTLPVVAPTPVLVISRSGALVTLSWPTFATGFSLEMSPVVPNTSPWTTVSGPYQTVGANFTATVNASSGSVAFFRLRK
jgi:uncharacterized repeat protein (TIGR03803 family)